MSNNKCVNTIKNYNLYFLYTRTEFKYLRKSYNKYLKQQKIFKTDFIIIKNKKIVLKKIIIIGRLYFFLYIEHPSNITKMLLTES